MVVQWGEIAGGGSVDRDMRGARTEPRGSPTLRGREKRRNRQRKLQRSKQEKEETKRLVDRVLAANCKAFNKGNQQGAVLECTWWWRRRDFL